GGARQRRRRVALLGASRRFSSGTVRVDDLRQRALAAGAHRDGRHHRHTERTLERRAVERVAALRGEVAHVEGDDHGPTQALQLQDQAQVEAQVGRVDHAHQQVGRGLGRVPAEHDVAGDGLIECGRLEAVGAGQVDDAEGTAAARTDQSAFLAFDRDARVIGHLLAAARQTVEERSLAAVGDADEREGELRRGQRRGRGGVHRSSSTLSPEPPGASWGSALVPECCNSTPFAAPATRAWGGAPDSEWCNSTPFAAPATRAWGGAPDSEWCNSTLSLKPPRASWGGAPDPERSNSTHTLCASRRRSASVVLPTRTTNGSRPGRASARISTCSPFTKPNSSSRRSSADRADAIEPTPTTRAVVPGGRAARLTKPGSRAKPSGATTASMQVI